MQTRTIAVSLFTSITFATLLSAKVPPAPKLTLAGKIEFIQANGTRIYTLTKEQLESFEIAREDDQHLIPEEKRVVFIGYSFEKIADGPNYYLDIAIITRFFDMTDETGRYYSVQLFRFDPDVNHDNKEPPAGPDTFSFWGHAKITSNSLLLEINRIEHFSKTTGKCLLSLHRWHF